MKLKLVIDIENDAYQGEDAGAGVAWTLRDLARRYEDRHRDRVLDSVFVARDINGNAVGYMKASKR